MIHEFGQWIVAVLSSDVFRGGALAVAVVTGMTAVWLQIIKNRPVVAKQEDEARAALDESTHKELVRLSDRLDQSDKRHAECEERSRAQRDVIATLESDVRGLRSQLLQYQESNVRVLQEAGAIPPDMVTTLRVLDA